MQGIDDVIQLGFFTSSFSSLVLCKWPKTGGVERKKNGKWLVVGKLYIY